jgi:hypothetical protein
MGTLVILLQSKSFLEFSELLSPWWLLTFSSIVGLRRAKGVLMSDCLHCDILEMLQSHPKGKEADFAEVAANVTQVLSDLIPMAPPDEQCMPLADVLANLGGMLLQKSDEDADLTSSSIPWN